MGKINLKSYTAPTQNLNFSAGDILRRTRLNQALQNAKQSYGLVTKGFLEATQVTGGYGWAISDYIKFAFIYNSMPIFTWGLDGTAGIAWSEGGNEYSQELPSILSTLSSENYQPAIFVPRVIHWHISDYLYYGCYLLVCQVNSECTEADKTVRIHFRFEGEGGKAV
jgi:hypothetical protein